MKKFTTFSTKIFSLKISLLFLSILGMKQATAQLIYIPDAAFAFYLQTEVPAAMIYPDSLDPNSAAVSSAISFDLSGLNIQDLTGISAFVNLQVLNCNANNLSTIPFIANSITIFDCNNNPNLTSISNLPNSLTAFNCSNCSLTSIPALPGALEYLDCESNQLTNLPSLPTTLVDLRCEFNQLSSLPTLPGSLISVFCYGNLLTTLPAIPSSVTHLDCGGNPTLVVPSLASTSITHLYIDFAVSTPFPALPASLVELGCSNMNPPLTSLPPFTPNFHYLHCSHNALTSLPLLPSGFRSIFCSSNNISYVSQPIPNSIQELDFSNNPITCIPQLPDTNISWFVTDITDCLFNKPLGCNDCQGYNTCSPAYSCNNMAYVSGTVFNDGNTDGTLNSGEPGRNKIYLFSNNGNFSTECDSNGSYFLPADTGISFVVNVQVPPYRVVSTAPVSHYFSNYGNIDSLNNVGIYDIPNINDLAVSLTSYPAVRPGLNYHSLLTMDNPGTTIQNGQVYLIKPSVMTFVSATPTQSSVSGDTIFWNFASFQPLSATANYDVVFLVPTSLVAGTVVNSYAGIIAAGNDTTPANNFAIDNQTVVNSCDPNDKQAEPAGGLTLSQIANGDFMYYTVRFQNTGTAPAINIVIADTLSLNLDLTTFNVVSASHAYTWKIENRVLYVRFENIMLADSNSNEPDSHGFIKYKVKPNNTLQIGDIMNNTAYIYFDFNIPVQTNTTNTVVLPTGTPNFASPDCAFIIFPNPTHQYLTVQFKDMGTPIQPLVSVLDIAGRVILFEQGKNSGDIMLNLNSISSGIYFLQLKYNDRIYQSKFVKD